MYKFSRKLAVGLAETHRHTPGGLHSFGCDYRCVWHVGDAVLSRCDGLLLSSCNGSLRRNCVLVGHVNRVFVAARHHDHVRAFGGSFPHVVAPQWGQGNNVRYRGFVFVLLGLSLPFELQHECFRRCTYHAMNF